MRRSPFSFRSLYGLVPVTTVLCALPVLGKEGGEGDHGHEAHVANWFNPLGEENRHAPALAWVMFTFAVFAAIVVRFGKKPLKSYVEQRHDVVKGAIEEAKKAKEEAEAKKREYEQRLAALDDEIAALKKEFEERGRAEMARLEEAGKRSAERIRKDAEETIAAETERAQQALKAEAAKLALELAEARIRQAVTDADEKRLRDQFLAELAN